MARLDTNSGTPGEYLYAQDGVPFRRVDGASLADFVPPGVLVKPSGQMTADWDTGLGPDALAGITRGPDGKLYFVDMMRSAVYRVDTP